MRQDIHPGIEAYISRLEPWQQQVFFEIRQLILSAHPMMEEHFTYQTPFYKLNGLFAYFTTLKKGHRTVLGICDGFLLSNHHNLLVAPEGQKQIRHIILRENHLPTPDVLLEILHEAVLLKINRHNKK